MIAADPIVEDRHAARRGTFPGPIKGKDRPVPFGRMQFTGHAAHRIYQALVEEKFEAKTQVDRTHHVRFAWQGGTANGRQYPKSQEQPRQDFAMESVTGSLVTTSEHCPSSHSDKDSRR